jgi:hypothetical protein
LVSISDPNSVGYSQLQLWDSNGTVAGGQFVVNGVPQSGGHEIDVARANVADTAIHVGTAGGSDVLFARLLQDNGQPTLWQSFTVTAPAVPLPTLSVSNDPTATRGQALPLSSLVSIPDPNSVGYSQLQLWDSNGTVAGGQFVINGVPQSGGHEIDVAPANLANTVFDIGTAGGSDVLWARLLQNNGQLTTWQSFTVTAPAVPLPTLSVTNDPTATRGQAVPLSSLVSISNPNGVGYSQLQLWDSNGTVAGGQFVVNGVPQGGEHEIDVAPANVANTVFDVGTAGGSDVLFARLLQNNGQPTFWKSFAVTAPTDTGPVMTPASSNMPAAQGQTFAASSLFTYSDPVNSPASGYDVWDTGGGGGYFALSGSQLNANQNNFVSAANLGQLTYHAGSGSDTLWMRAFDGAVWGPWSSSSTVTGAATAATGIIPEKGSYAEPSLLAYNDLLNGVGIEHARAPGVLTGALS